MRHVCGAKQQITGSDRGHFVLDPVTPSPGGNEVEFVALMGNLRPICGSGGEPNLQVAVNERLG
jgi:hypothetical protein